MAGAALPDLWSPIAASTVHVCRNTMAKKMGTMNSHHRAAETKGLTSIADAAYRMAVLTLYIDLPDTPRRASAYDQAVARSLFQQAVPLEVVEAAFLLASLRRLIRPPKAPPLPPIRSLAYFSAVIAELHQQPMPAGYLDYLRQKAGQVFLQIATSQAR